MKTILKGYVPKNIENKKKKTLNGQTYLTDWIYRVSDENDKLP